MSHQPPDRLISDIGPDRESPRGSGASIGDVHSCANVRHTSSRTRLRTSGLAKRRATPRTIYPRTRGDQSSNGTVISLISR